MLVQPEALVSNTSSSEMRMMWRIPKAEMEAKNILFQAEDSEDYIHSMLGACTRPMPTARP